MAGLSVDTGARMGAGVRADLSHGPQCMALVADADVSPRPTGEVVSAKRRWYRVRLDEFSGKWAWVEYLDPGERFWWIMGTDPFPSRAAARRWIASRRKVTR